MPEDRKTPNRIAVEIEKDLHMKFKVKCYSLGTTIKDRIIELITNDVKSEQ